MEVRTTLPSATNKYYLKSPTGYNPCILGEPGNRPYPQSNLANCVGAAVGRFNELIAEGNCNYLGNRMPGAMVQLARSQGLVTGNKPKPGACAVFVKADGKNGHCMSIEKVEGDKIFTFESGYYYKAGKYFTNRTVYASNNYGMSRLYGAPTFIYNPNIDPYPIPPKAFSTYYTREGDYVKFVQWVLVKEKCYLLNKESEIDGIAGSKTQKAIKKYQEKHGLKVDGWAGPDTCGVMKKDHAIV